MKPFEELIAEAESETFAGWNFSYLEGRLIENPTPWDYRGIVSKLLPSVNTLVDLGTGGGEFLASLHPLPPHTFATEGYAPNVIVAKQRLEPLGVKVIENGCDDNTSPTQEGTLPFNDGSIDLVIDRHESFVATEVFRVLRPHGLFVTQQVGDSNYPELNRALGSQKAPNEARWNLRKAIKQIKTAGFRVTDSREARMEARFLDVGAIVYYLKAIPWQVPSFSIQSNHDALKRLDDTIRKHGSFRVTFPRFLVQAAKIPS